MKHKRTQSAKKPQAKLSHPDLNFSLLLIEGGKLTAGIIDKFLKNVRGASIHVEYQYSLAGALERLEKGGIDAVLLDLYLPDSKGIETFLKLAVKSGHAPIVVLAEEKNQDVALEAVRRGAQDYVIKGKTNGELLFRAVHNAIERQQAEERLLKTTLELNALFQAFPDLSLRVTGDGVIIDYNAGPSANLFALPLDFLGKALREVFPPPASQILEKALGNVRAKRSVEAVEYSIKNRGVEKWYEARLLPFLDTQIMMVIRDISQRKKLEHLRDEFVSAVSHELRTPLTIMKEAVLQVTEGMLGDISPEQRENLKTALDGIARLRRLIDDLLDLSKLEAGRMPLYREKVDMGEVVRGLVSGFLPQAKFKQLELTVSCPPKPVSVYADPDKIIQVLVNLLGNALKFTDSGYVKVHVSEREHGVECCVEDTGIGISKEDIPKVFDKFQQFARRREPHEKGTGLGLSLSKALVEMHDGEIWVESGNEKGCRFIFRLPKYSSFEIFRQHLLERIREAVHDEASLLVVRLWVKNYAALRKNLDAGKLPELGQALEKYAKESLRRKGDMAVGIRAEDREMDKEELNVWLLFPQALKSDAPAIMTRALAHIKNSLSKEPFGGQIELDGVFASYPEDGRSAEEIIQKLLEPAHAH